MTRTSRLVVDSWAWLELFAGSDRGKEVEQGISGARETFTSVISLAEIVSVAARRARPTGDKVAVIRSQSKVVAPSSEDAVEAGLLHANTRRQATNFSLADAFVLGLARKVGGKVLTGDPDFKGLDDVVYVGRG